MKRGAEIDLAAAGGSGTAVADGGACIARRQGETCLFFLPGKEREDGIDVLTKELSALSSLIYFLTIEAS
jgi:hypothetical protein